MGLWHYRLAHAVLLLMRPHHEQVEVRMHLQQAAMRRVTKNDRQGHAPGHKVQNNIHMVTARCKSKQDLTDLGRSCSRVFLLESHTSATSGESQLPSQHMLVDTHSP